jgi:hypothetical protein
MIPVFIQLVVVATKMEGTAKMNESSAATLRFIFCANPPKIAAAERDTPGINGKTLKATDHKCLLVGNFSGDVISISLVPPIGKNQHESQ